MKIKVKIKLFEGQHPLEDIAKGDYIDLRTNKTLDLNKGELHYIPLGVAMELPEGFYARVLPRSSTPKKFGVFCANSEGVIDHSYCGDSDEWKFPAYAFRDTTICKGDRIAQFTICLSQKATVWQKLKWLFSSGIEFEYVDILGNPNRGGFGSTGKN